VKISIVIPTYNRPDQLSRVLDHLLASDVKHPSDVEVIVVDDGSSTPCREVLDSKVAVAPFRLRYLYQKNLGPAEARNHGFREATNDLILFIDDDILVSPDLLERHVQAHLDRPGSVIYGRSPYFEPDVETSAYRYLKGLADEYHRVGSGGVEAADPEYVPIEVVASGNISVEKHQFEGGVYGSGLSIPVSEEFALALKLRNKQTPIYFAPRIVGWHLQPATIQDSCIQNYKYGLGIAEVVAKMPEILELEQVNHVYRHNSPRLDGSTLTTKLKKKIRSVLAPKVVRDRLLGLINFLEKNGVRDAFLFPLYRLVVGTYFFAGIRDGEKRFGRAA
jgi:hypothetical protein